MLPHGASADSSGGPVVVAMDRSGACVAAPEQDGTQAGPACGPSPGQALSPQQQQQQQKHPAHQPGLPPPLQLHPLHTQHHTPQHAAQHAAQHALAARQSPQQSPQQPRLQPPQQAPPPPLLQQQQQQQQPPGLAGLGAGGDADVKVQALEALNSSFCHHIYSTALSFLHQQYSLDAMSAQFLEILDQDDPYDSPCTVAHQDANSAKNRYRDVVPYDHNRVHLPPLKPAAAAAAASGAAARGGSLEGSGYINASFMADPQLAGDQQGYIATQGPLPSTVCDFWRMVAVTNTSAIVMLTGLSDGSPTLGNSRPRCAPYFPDQEGDVLELPGAARVTCVHRNSLYEGVHFRQLEVVWASQPEPRLWINHYEYAGWPDYGVPSTSTSVLALCHALDGCRRTGCKIVAHCSAGVGRTGTFIAVDVLLQRLHSLTLRLHGSVTDADIVEAMNIPRLVVSLRKQRRGTVQTGEQYGFIWQAVMEELQRLLAQCEEELQQQQQQPSQPS